MGNATLPPSYTASNAEIIWNMTSDFADTITGHKYYKIPSSTLEEDFSVAENLLADAVEESLKLNYEPASGITLRAGKTIIELILRTDSHLYFINPLPIGGFGFEFNYKDSYYNIEIDNENDAVYYKEVSNQIPIANDLSFDQLLEQLKTELA